MLTQTKEVRDAWRASQRTLDIKVAVNGKTYTATDINSLKYDSGAYTGDTFAIGSTYSNNVQIEFSHLVEGLELGMEVRPSIGIKTSKGYIYEPLGIFIISSEIKMDRNNNLTSISASDRFVGLEGKYKSKLVYPAKVLDIIAEICAQSGVKANADDLARLPHQADLPIPISGQSYRKALGWIAQLYAGYATFDRQGLFTIRTIAEPNYELDPSQYEQAGLTKNEAPYKIGGIQCQTVITTKTRDGENTEETKTYQVGDTSGSQIKLENNIMTPDRLNNIWEQIKDISFYPFNLNWFGNPAIEAGDWLRLEDKQGNKFIVPNNSYTLDFNGGLSATSKADQTSSTDSAISWRGTYAQIIEELQARKAPDGTVIFPPSVVEPPKNAKPNDVWFKQNGNSTELWVFTAQEDGSGKWIRRDLTPDEIKKQVQEAQSGLNDARKQIADNLAKADGDIAELNANIREQKKAFDTDIDELNKSISDQKGSLDGLSTTVNTVVIPKVTDVTNKVSDTITKVNEQKNIVTELQNQATQQGKDISKITADVHGVTVDLANLNGDVNQTKATVQGLQSTLGNAQGDIAQIKVDAKKLETSLSGKVDNSTYATFVNQTNQALNAKLVASDLNGYAKTTDVQATANGLQLNINSVSGKLDNLVIGNRNLVRNSGFPINTDYWNGPEIAKHEFYYSNTKPLFLLKNNSSEENTAKSAYFPLKRNTTYVASFKGFSSANTSSYDVFILARKYGENSEYTTIDRVVNTKRLSPSKVDYIKDLVFNSGENDEAYIRFDNNGSSDGNESLLFFTEVKVEEGNKSTAWTPAPEDEQDRINGITSQLSARITANSQQFSSYYSKTDVDQKVSGVQSQITQNATGLQSVVAKVDNIRIGGTNLIRNSNFDTNLRGIWYTNGNYPVVWQSPGVGLPKGDLIQNIPAKPNTTYTFSFDLWYQDVTEKWGNQFFFVEHKDSECTKTTNTYVDHRWAGDQFPNTVGRKDKKLTFTTQPDCYGLKMYIRQESNKNQTFRIAKPKLEEGNQATDWSPAPEDKANQSDYSALNQTVKGIQSTVSSNYGNLQSQISQTAGTISTVVGKVNNLEIATNVQIVDHGIDLNTYKSTGTWFVKGSGTNAPASNWFYLDVKTAWDGRIVQIWQSDDVPTDRYVRTYIDDHWSNWERSASYSEYSTLNQTVKGLQSTVSSNYGNLQSQISQTAGTIRDEVTNKISGVQSQIDQTVKGLQSTVSSNYGNLQSQISQTAGTIRNEITNKVSGLQSQITQNANNINLKVNAIGDLSNICLNPNFMDGSTSGWENISSSVGNTSSPSKFYGCLSIRDGYYGNMFPVVTGDKYYFSIYAWQDQSLHNFSIGFAYLLKDGSWYWQPALTFSPNESGREKTGTITIPSNVDKARIWVQIDASSDYGHWWFTNVNVRKNDTLAQINVAAGTTLIQNDKIYMDASSTVFSGKAFIPDAAITNISADKINTGTLDAGRINVINLNANNITTGTINGANLKIDLNSGEILFQKGRIASTNGLLNIDLNFGTMSVTGWGGAGVYFQNGKMILDDGTTPNLDLELSPKYGMISRSKDFVNNGLFGMQLESPNGVIMKTKNYDGTIFHGLFQKEINGAFLGVSSEGDADIVSGRHTIISGGLPYGDTYPMQPTIVVGTEDGRDYNGSGKKGSRIVLSASYVHLPDAYNTTTSSAPNMVIAWDGAIVRSTSASKYKTDIKRSHSTDYGEKLLNLPIATWTDKGQKERYETGKRHIKPEKYFGMIAEDLADAGLDLLVSRNPQTHEIEGIQYERIGPALLPVIKELKDKVNRLENKVNE